ncbi:hypothetical protein RRG08_022088 [Elysia crispata]|uniref:Uncharacterized protein n=1 Tax=Elysia crispata TaxID=231223 RepID=A0AAE1CQY7_9GAST|nr:hypothetical protein RRG08_022088 [Elysia crispata]
MESFKLSSSQGQRRNAEFRTHYPLAIVMVLLLNQADEEDMSGSLAVLVLRHCDGRRKCRHKSAIEFSQPHGVLRDFNLEHFGGDG